MKPADAPAISQGTRDVGPVFVYSSLFPNAAQPNAGLFIRERMFRVRTHGPMVVVSPQPWFPFQGLIQKFKPGYRVKTAHHEIQDGTEVFFPRFLALPGVLRGLDGWSMALCTWPLMRRLKRRFGEGIIDAHFAYPCGKAATLLGRWLGLPVSITLRGTETRQLRTPGLAEQVLCAVRDADMVVSVADSLKRLVRDAGGEADKIQVIGNGVDVEKFSPIEQAEARRRLGLPVDAKVLVTVGGLVERKGFHRVIDCLPEIIANDVDVHYVVIGGGSPEGDMSEQLRAQVRTLGLESRVLFTGPVAPAQLAEKLSAADVFVLSTRNEGWANVFLEAMACGLPVVTTDVGGNAEVVCRPELGHIVPFGDHDALRDALIDSLDRPWSREAILAYARDNTWDNRIDQLTAAFVAMRAKRKPIVEHR